MPDLRGAARRARAVVGRTGSGASDARGSGGLPPGLLDLEWVSRQLGRPLRDHPEAVAAYRRGGPEVSPHPLVAPDWLDPSRPWAGRSSALDWWLTEAPDRSPHPLLHLPTLRARGPVADDHPAGPVVAFLESLGTDTALPVPPGVPPTSYGELRAAAFAALAARSLLTTLGPSDRPADGLNVVSNRQRGRVSVLLALPGSLRRGVHWVLDGAATRATGVDVEVVVAGRLRPAHRVLVDTLSGLYAGPPAVLVPAGAPATRAASLGARVATGDRLVLVRGGVTTTCADAVRLAARLADPALSLVQPLVLDDRGLVVSAGAVFDAGPEPTPLLAGHAAADARGVHVVPAVLSPVVACRAADLDAAGGLDPAYADDLAETDLSLRLAGRSVLDPTVAVLARAREVDAEAVRTFVARHPTPPGGSGAAWAAAGFDVVAGTVRPVRPAVHEGPPRLRWTIDLAAPAGPKGEAWGDVHFARALAAALERLGQHVAVDGRAARHRPTRDLDDVVLVLRGLDRVQPRPGLVDVLWVISHPDEVGAEEAAAYDLVYAASTTWARDRGAAWGREVRPLLQCTDPRWFHPGLAEPDTGPPVLFVGNARGGVFRSSVRGAVAAGVDLTVYGQGWDGLVPPGTVVAPYVANRDLGALYAAAAVVLNDHWDDMRRDGFLANRLFDAAACGARVISDAVPGLAEVFGDQVATYASEGDLARLLADPASAFPSVERRRELAAAVVRDHSFDARAAVLLADVAALRARG